MTSHIKSQHKTLSSVAVQKILQDIDTIIAERKQELSNIRQRSSNNSTSNSFYSHEIADCRNKTSSAIVENNLNSFTTENIDRTPTNVINNDVDSNHNEANLATPFNLEYSVSQPHSAGSVEQECVEGNYNNNQLDNEDLFPELDGAQKEELTKVSQSLNFEANDSAGVSLYQSKLVDGKVKVRIVDDSSVNSSFLAESIASDEQQCVRVSPEELNQPIRPSHQTLKEDSISETFSFGDFEELEELLDENDHSGFSRAMDDGSLSSCNLNYHAIYGHSESGIDPSSANNSRNVGSSRNNSTSGMSSSMGTVGQRSGAIHDSKRIETTLYSSSQVNPQRQLALKNKQQQQQQQLQLTQQKNELLEKKLHDIEKLIDSDFSEHSLQTKMLNNERAKLWSLKVALEEELEEMREELLLVRSQLQNKSIRANEFEVRLQELQARLDVQIQEKHRISHQLLLAETEAAAERERANALAAELSQVQDSIIELSAQLQVRQQVVFEEQQLQEKEAPISEHIFVAEMEPLSFEVSTPPPVEQEQPPAHYTPSELAALEEQLHSALTENDMLAKCLEEILWERNELVDRLEQAKVVVQQRDEAVEEMQSLLNSTQEQLKRSTNLYRPPFVEKTWVVKELTIPRIKKSYVPRLVTVAICLLGIWIALLVGLIAYTSATEPGRSSCPYGSSQCPLSIRNFVTS